MAHDDGQHERHINAQLGRGAKQQADGVSQHGAKVRHGADAHEDQAGEDAAFDALAEEIQQAGFCPGFAVGRRGHQPAQRQVDQQHTKGDGQQQHGLKFFDNGQVNQRAGHCDHHGLLPGDGH